MAKNEMGRRSFLRLTSVAGAAASMGLPVLAGAEPAEKTAASERKPNVLFIMTDQQRFDTIASLGNPHIHTPNLDRLGARGVVFTNAYSTCPVCVPARMTVYTGCEPPTTGIYENGAPNLVPEQAAAMEDRCGPYLPRTMRGLGYRTFGIGKFHTAPWDLDLGFDVHLHSEELYGSPDQRTRDSYAAFIREKHPELDYIEALMGERTEMYYMPQMSALPAHLGVEAWAADRAIEQLQTESDRPYFGYVSFIGPHPPFAPPLPFNRMYDPDRMPDPVTGDAAVDLMDEQLRWMNHAIWAEDINNPHARVLKARYYGEISYIDHCIGRILDAVDARGDADNTLICFYADHGDHLGDHRAWQKESFFEAASHVPFLVSWPAQIAAGQQNGALVTLADLFGIATTAAGKPELREGADVLGVLAGRAEPRRHLVGYYGRPGTNIFKTMVRRDDWKYIFMANGGQEQLFNVREDPAEVQPRTSDSAETLEGLRGVARQALNRTNVNRALTKEGDLLRLPETDRPPTRFYQFDQSRGVTGFPANPGDALKTTKIS